MSNDDKPKRRRHPFLNVQIAFFVPLWRRIAAFGVLVFWTYIEFANGSQAWGALAGGITVFIGYQFFLAFDPDDEDDAPEG